MRKIAATEMHDYWFAEVVPPFRRLQYAFVVTDDHEDIFFGSSGVCPYNEKHWKRFIITLNFRLFTRLIHFKRLNGSSQRFGIKFFRSVSQMEEKTCHRRMHCRGGARTRASMIFLEEICKGLLTSLII